MSFLSVVAAMIFTCPACFAGNEGPTKSVNPLCTQSTTINVTVDLTPDCDAVQYCSWEVLLYDLTGCYVNEQPIDIKDYTYGQTLTFNTVTFYNSYVRVCVRVKPDTHCTYENYAPKCECQPLGSGDLHFDIDICTP